MNTTTWIIILVAVILVDTLISALVAISIKKNSDAKKIGTAEDKARGIIDDAIKTAEAKKKEALLEAKEENLKTKNELDKEIKERRSEVQRYEKRVLNKEEAVEKKSDALDRKENSLKSREEELNKAKEKVEQLSEQRIQELERISGLTSEQAKEQLLQTVEEEIKIETAKVIKEHEKQAKEEADKKAKELVVNAIQKCATDHVAETTISVVSLPNDEMKGRIIGREGRNIRTLESLTGVDLIIDDTPEAVVLSGFDPIRREVARIALEKLVVDGRIQPTRIEEMVNKAQKEVETMIREEGEAATLEVGVHGIHPELVKLLGKMKFRTSYGQNALKHSIEVALISGLLASELGLDVRVAKRAGLLHDIGKAVDHEKEGTHIQLGVDLCRKYKESATVINAIEAHHGDVEPETLIACIVQAADAISAARPGARRETVQTYTNRLKQLEDITNSYEGVDKSFAIQAGREVRIMVIPEKVSDADMVLMARNIAKAICAGCVEYRKRHSLIHNKKFHHRITELCYNFYRLKKIGGNMFKLGFIGMGNMGSAILNGVSKLYNKDDIVFHSSTKKKMEKISEETGVKFLNNNEEVIKNSKYIILAVKPQMFESVLPQVKENVTQESVVVSLAPGVTIEQLEDMCGTKKIVRTMPNTPAMVGEGMTGVSYNEEFFSQEEKEEIEKIFSSFGKMRVVEEKIMDAVVCASGSSPAYVFMFIEALADSVVKCGMKRSDAYEFVAQTVLGSAKLMLETNEHPGVLKDNVCSPGGTTIAAVEQLENNGFRKALFAASDACYKKCKGIE